MIEPRWRVLRQDDHGNVVVVEVVEDERAARALVERLAAGGHKQLYWSERGEASFRVASVFAIPPKGIGVIAGDVVDGRIAAGMRVRGLESVAGEIQVASVESVSMPGGTKVGLAFALRDRHVFERLRAALPAGATISVVL